MTQPSDAQIADALMDLAHRRSGGKTFCPSEVARLLTDDWRPLMPRIRALTATLPLRATQGGTPVDPVTAKGPIRIGLIEPTD